MRVAVCVKWVADLDSVEVDPATGAVDASRLLYTLDGGSESALALGLRLGEVHAYTVGDEESDAALRIALAAGARSVHRLEASPQPALTSALLAAAIVSDGPFELVLTGTRSSDHASGEVPSLLASTLGLPIVNEVRLLEPRGAGWHAVRELERGAKELVDVEGPAVVAVVPGLARLPRASLPRFTSTQHAAIPVRRLTIPPLPTAPTVLSRSTLPPRPRVLPLQEPSGSADQRLGAILSSGGSRTRGRMIEGAPGPMADAILALLRERGLLAK